MKNIIVLAFIFLGFYGHAQIKGDQNIVTKSFDIGQFDSLYLGLYAQYEIDMANEAILEITIDENLMPMIERDLQDGNLVINQLKWIAPSQDPIIKIGAKRLKKLTQSSHSRTMVKNLNQERFTVQADVGDVFLEGRVERLNVEVGTGDVDASKLQAASGDFKFESWGTIKANVSGTYETENKGEGKLIINGDVDKAVADESIRFMKFVLRNNSINRHQFYVVGPKPDGSKFSYGFPMMPYQKRDKDWTNGTRIYKVNNLGLRKLVKVISTDDEGGIVDIFDN